ncbi:uncharacterized protein LOC117585535 [Drosophila guanche]|uniref:Uncharacterized protein n=1 Tax=Drosophila guanche TaxID=7266 RepID=A0A3B0KC80_DROGU|nr:uncharacterized protein LOC117585535 [Drosophila guanche]SPP83316.1 Hypothetical predicted protein [Drosophila guanche]
MRCVTLLLLWGTFRIVWGENQTQLCQQAVNPRHSLLSRRVRGLVFPDKASLLVTAALTKIIVGGRPSGLQYSLEFDMYLPLPDTVEGWEPKISKNPKHKPKTRRRWDWAGSNAQRPIKYAPYYSPQLTANSFYQSPWHLSTQIQQQPQEETYESWSHVPQWKLHRGYRERRDIYDQFEALGRVFQLDVRSCIKRAMCELRTRLKGGFLMEDLMRIILTVPEELTADKYKHPSDIQDCVRFYALSCPYNVLDFLTQNYPTSGSK